MNGMVAQRQGAVSWAQVLLRWCVQHGACVIPRSSSPPHIQANCDISASTVELTQAEMEALDAIGSRPQRFCWDPTKVA